MTTSIKMTTQVDDLSYGVMALCHSSTSGTVLLWYESFVALSTWWAGLPLEENVVNSMTHTHSHALICLLCGQGLIAIDCRVSSIKAINETWADQRLLHQLLEKLEPCHEGVAFPFSHLFLLVAGLCVCVCVCVYVCVCVCV